MGVKSVKKLRYQRLWAENIERVHEWKDLVIDDEACKEVISLKHA